MTTAVSDRRWHEIPAPGARVIRVENLLIDVYDKIAKIHHAIGQVRFDNDRLKERVEQLELENDQLRTYVYNG